MSEQEAIAPEIIEVHGWQNNDNLLIYNAMPISKFRKTAMLGGLENGCDLDQIDHYIFKAGSILEVGAGYGRVINNLLNKEYSGKLHAIERDAKCCHSLRTKFGEKADIIQTDLKGFQTNNRFDLILWMWTGIVEFSKSEQLSALRRLAACLNENGYICIDVVPLTEKTLNTVCLQGQNHVIKTEFGNDYCYFPSESEMAFYAENLKLRIVECIHYQSLPNRTRIIYILGH